MTWLHNYLIFASGNNDEYDMEADNFVGALSKMTNRNRQEI